MTDDGKLLKDLYRRAMQKCHPDRASAESYSSMLAKAKELTAAYRAGNLSLVRKIAEELGVKDISPTPKSESAGIFRKRDFRTADELNSRLSSAAERGDVGAVKDAIGLGADPNSKSVPIWGAFHLARTIFPNPNMSALDLGIEIAEILLAAGANPNTVLPAAAGDGHAKFVRVLLTAGANPDAVDEDGNTALIMAAVESRHPHLEVVNMLLAAGANPNAANPRNGQTALHRAAHDGLAEFAEMLLAAGTNPDAVDKEGNTALDYAEYGMYRRPSYLAISKFKEFREVVRLLKEANREITRLLEEEKPK